MRDGLGTLREKVDDKETKEKRPLTYYDGIMDSLALVIPTLHRLEVRSNRLLDKEDYLLYAKEGLEKWQEDILPQVKIIVREMESIHKQGILKKYEELLSDQIDVEFAREAALKMEGVRGSQRLFQENKEAFLAADSQNIQEEARQLPMFMARVERIADACEEIKRSLQFIEQMRKVN